MLFGRISSGICLRVATVVFIHLNICACALVSKGILFHVLLMCILSENLEENILDVHIFMNQEFCN